MFGINFSRHRDDFNFDEILDDEETPNVSPSFNNDNVGKPKKKIEDITTKNDVPGIYSQLATIRERYFAFINEGRNSPSASWIHYFGATMLDPIAAPFICLTFTPRQSFDICKELFNRAITPIPNEPLKQSSCDLVLPEELFAAIGQECDTETLLNLNEAIKNQYEIYKYFSNDELSSYYVDAYKKFLIDISNKMQFRKSVIDNSSFLFGLLTTTIPIVLILKSRAALSEKLFFLLTPILMPQILILTYYVPKEIFRSISHFLFIETPQCIKSPYINITECAKHDFELWVSPLLDFIKSRKLILPNEVNDFYKNIQDQLPALCQQFLEVKV